MNKYFWIVFIICFCSCSDNSCYIDFHNQTLVRCNNEAMQRVSIYPREKIDYETSLEPIDSKGCYSIKYLGDEANKDNNIYFTKPNNNYAVLFENKLVANKMIRLKPSTKYNIIHRSNGDATPFSISIETDEIGEIKTAGKTDCN